MVNYSPVGSGTGEKDIAGGLVDFGASDAPLSVYPTAPANLVQIPWALTATGVSYHLNGLKPKTPSCSLTGSVLAQIYLGQITNWDSKAIKKLNKGVKIPNKRITGVLAQRRIGRHVSRSPGTSRMSASPFRTKVGSLHHRVLPESALARRRQRRHGARREGTNGGIAYIAVSYLIANKLPAVAIQNGAGNYEVPNLSAIAAAASGISVPANQPGHDRRPGKAARRRTRSRRSPTRSSRRMPRRDP